MVTKVNCSDLVNEVLTHPLVRLKMVAGELDIPIVIRPWWGSRRVLNRQVHRGCGGDLVHYTDMDLFHCYRCSSDVRVEDTEIQKVPHTWEHPGVQYPEVERGVVVFWEGPCGNKKHNHSQTVEVIDVGASAFLVKITAGPAGTNILIGMDDGHPFGTPVARRITTVQDAFDWLVPTRVREAMVMGLDVKRQGDWFFIPMDKEPRLRPNPTHGRADRVRGSRPTLYMGELYQWAPLLYNMNQTRHRGEQVVYYSIPCTYYGAPRVRGDVISADHPTVHLETWHLGLRRRSLAGSSAVSGGAD